jgi:hypothetical protein
VIVENVQYIEYNQTGFRTVAENIKCRLNTLPGAENGERAKTVT